MTCVWAPVELIVPLATIAVPGRVALARRARARRRGEPEGRASRRGGRRVGTTRGFAVETRTICHHGAPWRAIVDCAAELDAAAIVTGTRGRSLPVAAVLGGTAEGVLHHAHRPVFVVCGD